MLTSVPLTHADLEEGLAALAAEHPGLLLGSPERLDAYRAQASRPGHYYAVRLDGTLLGCGGITDRFDETGQRLLGVGEAWVLWTPAARTHRRLSYRTLRRLLLELIDGLALTDLYAFVLHDYPEAHRLAQHLGMRCIAQEAADSLDCYYGRPKKEAAIGR